MLNYWLKKANEMVEKEVLLIKRSLDIQKVYESLPAKLPIIFTYTPKSPLEQDYMGKVGICHHLHLCKSGIEGVLKMPKRYHRYPLYVLQSSLQKSEPFWVVVYDGIL